MRELEETVNATLTPPNIHGSSVSLRLLKCPLFSSPPPRNLVLCYPQLQVELERAATRLRELEETVKTQRRALSSMQQQLSTVSGTTCVDQLMVCALHLTEERVRQPTFQPGRCCTAACAAAPIHA
jgi:hypothetical protein